MHKQPRHVIYRTLNAITFSNYGFFLNLRYHCCAYVNGPLFTPQSKSLLPSILRFLTDKPPLRVANRTFGNRSKGYLFQAIKQGDSAVFLSSDDYHQPANGRRLSTNYLIICRLKTFSLGTTLLLENVTGRHHRDKMLLTPLSMVLLHFRLFKSQKTRYSTKYRSTKALTTR